MSNEYPEPTEYELEDDGSSDEDNYDIEDDDDAEYEEGHDEFPGWVGDPRLG